MATWLNRPNDHAEKDDDLDGCQEFHYLSKRDTSPAEFLQCTMYMLLVNTKKLSYLNLIVGSLINRDL